MLTASSACQSRSSVTRWLTGSAASPRQLSAWASRESALAWVSRSSTAASSRRLAIWCTRRSWRRNSRSTCRRLGSSLRASTALRLISSTGAANATCSKALGSPSAAWASAACKRGCHSASASCCSRARLASASALAAALVWAAAAALAALAACAAVVWAGDDLAAFSAALAAALPGTTSEPKPLFLKSQLNMGGRSKRARQPALEEEDNGEGAGQAWRRHAA